MHISSSRTLLDSAFENEAKCKSETEAAKREVMRLSDKLEQVTAETHPLEVVITKPSAEQNIRCKNRMKGLEWKFRVLYQS